MYNETWVMWYGSYLTRESEYCNETVISLNRIWCCDLVNEAWERSDSD